MSKSIWYSWLRDTLIVKLAAITNKFKHEVTCSRRSVMHNVEQHHGEYPSLLYREEAQFGRYKLQGSMTVLAGCISSAPTANHPCHQYALKAKHHAYKRPLRLAVNRAPKKSISGNNDISYVRSRFCRAIDSHQLQVPAAAPTWL